MVAQIPLWKGHFWGTRIRHVPDTHKAKSKDGQFLLMRRVCLRSFQLAGVTVNSPPQKTCIHLRCGLFPNYFGQFFYNTLYNIVLCIILTFTSITINI